MHHGQRYRHDGRRCNHRGLGLEDVLRRGERQAVHATIEVEVRGVDQLLRQRSRNRRGPANVTRTASCRRARSSPSGAAGASGAQATPPFASGGELRLRAGAPTFTARRPIGAAASRKGYPSTTCAKPSRCCWGEQAKGAYLAQPPSVWPSSCCSRRARKADARSAKPNESPI